MLANLEDSAVATGLENTSFHYNFKEGQCQRMFKLTIQLHSFQMLAKFVKVGFSSMWTENFQMYRLHFEKAEKPEINLPTFTGSWRKQGSSRKISISTSLTTWKLLTVCITRNWKILKEMGIPDRTNLYSSQESTVRTRHGTMTGWKLGKEYNKAMYCHPVCLTS